jgi:twitching motility protein PilJ
MTSKTIGERLLAGLGTALIGVLIVGAIVCWWVGWSVRREDALERYLLQQAVVAQALATHAPAAAHGDEAALGDLARVRHDLETLATEPPAGLSGEATGALGRARSQTIEPLGALLEAQPALQTAATADAQVRDLMPQLLEGAAGLAAMLGASERAAITPHLDRFELAAKSLQQDLEAIATGVGNITHALERVRGGDEYMSQILRGLGGQDSALGITPVSGANATAQLQKLNTTYGRIADEVRSVVAVGDRLIAAQATAERLSAASGAWETILRELSARSAQPRAVMQYLPVALILFAIGTLFAMRRVYRGSTEARRLAEAQGEQNDRNQRAILRLLDELGSLADGDLTVQATVTEDITGAIADSINYAVEALRALVTTIERTAIQIDAAARQTQASAVHLARASENQSQQVAASTESIANMAISIEEVSGNAERSSDVARHSVDVAHKGSTAVRRTIEGMNAIRETIQETSKRIKRLGESSQEIGNIVELINDIAEQTNILALNASIQASMAGEQGRGFAVVADEVQRLAEKSANATKQIEVLVRTIQSDTNEAVVSMERSTTDVVSGALLAENAGASLEEIEKVSNQIAMLVQNISNTARQQATAAAGMARNMGVLQEISAQTAESTGATSEAIAKLAAQASELRRSVAGFTLPESDPPTMMIDHNREMREDDVEMVPRTVARAGAR